MTTSLRAARAATTVLAASAVLAALVPVTAASASASAWPVRASVVPSVVVPSVAAAAPRPGRFALGDSVLLGSKPALVAQHFVVDAKVSRQFVSAPKIVRARLTAGTLPRNVVVHLGTNGTVRLSDCKALVAAAGSSRRVFLLTLHVPRSWMAADNRVLHACDASFPGRRVVLLDWAKLSAGHSSWFAHDGFHPSSIGRPHYVRLIDHAVDLYGL